MKQFFLCLTLTFMLFVKQADAQQKLYKISYQFADPETGTKYDFITVPNLDYALYTEGDLTGIMDLKGNILLPANYEIVSEYRDNLALTMVNHTYQLINKAGNNQLKTDYEFLSFAGEKLLLAFKDDRYGYIDYMGKIIIPFKLQNAQAFESGMALVTEDLENFYYIDAKGKFIKKYEE